MTDRIEKGMIVLFDESPLAPGTMHGPLGPNHYATMKLPQYRYQLEMLFQQVLHEHPKVVRAEAWDGRKWEKQGGCFVLVAEGGGEALGDKPND